MEFGIAKQRQGFILDLFDNKLKNKREIGESLEDFALKFIQNHGLRIVTKNYFCKMGEIDIIARDEQNFVFIEVRYRSSDAFGGSEASVGKKKQRRIILAAAHYLQKNGLNNKTACRFDVVALTGKVTQLKYNWIKGAFDAVC